MDNSDDNSEDNSGWIKCERPHILPNLPSVISQEEYIRTLAEFVGQEEATRMYTSSATPKK